ncbi:MAG: stage II sporulation protein R [Clostridia bacterium]|nr:stage II sporulation protein R [Clostridia bacterium]
MKKLGITFLLLSIIVTAVVVGASRNENGVEYLRIHIRANSNSELDQSVKYRVKSAIVDYLTPFIAECETKEQAIKMLTLERENLEGVANSVLNLHGFDYESKVAVRKESFPTRVYGDFTLEEGIYDAIIVELGEGKGDNWWCVVYPPLCFTKTQNVKYKSKILEVIEAFKERVHRG